MLRGLAPEKFTLVEIKTKRSQKWHFWDSIKKQAGKAKTEKMKIYPAIAKMMCCMMMCMMCAPPAIAKK